jgi:P27 family predicted phage terminase small subunit
MTIPANMKNADLMRTPPPADPVEDMPDWLHPLAREEWQRVVPQLHSIGAFTVVDVTPIASYCQTYAMWREAYDMVMRDGISVRSPRTGALVTNPAFNASARLIQSMLAFSRHYGFSPQSRGGIKKPSNSQGDKDEFDAFLKS